jgi:hypothetical protein
MSLLATWHGGYDEGTSDLSGCGMAKYYIFTQNQQQQLKVRLHYRAKLMLDEFARRVFDKFAPSKAAISAFLLEELAFFGTLHDCVNAP